jgi:SAM-dependent methyltransferase
MLCPLCTSVVNYFYNVDHREYYFCSECFSVSLNPKNYISENAEIAHYKCHNNDVLDPKYQQFASPIVNTILKDFNSNHKGLDFGSGTHSVIVKLLRDSKYNVVEFDPYFAKNEALLQKKYDYISCCEVIEHFQNPRIEFEKLFSLLKPNGKLYCMTHLFSETNNFDSWYYKNDPTHVFFYHQKTIAWIANHFGFSNFSIQNRLIVFEK